MHPSAKTNDPPDDAPLLHIPAYVHAHLVQRVYAIVALQLCTTVGVSATFMYAPEVHAWVTSGIAFPLMAWSTAWALLFACTVSFTRHPWDVLGLAAFTLAESVSVGVVCAVHDSAVVLASFAVAAGLFALLSVAACAMRRPLDHPAWVGVPLALLLTAAVFATFNMAVGPLPWMHVGVSVLGLLAVSGFVLYDTSQLMHRYGPDEAIQAALQLYLDAINLFLCGLQLLSGTDA